MKNFAGRIDNMPTSIFATMSKKAIEFNAVNLGQGFPDFDGPQWIMDKAYEAMKESKNQYAPSPGILSLRQNLSKNYESIYGIGYNPLNEIIVTAGATEALYSTITALIDKGDEVIKQLNGSEVLGRKIRVDVSQKKSSNQRDGKPKKSSRELRAMREEAEDGKKPKRKPRHKKD